MVLVLSFVGLAGCEGEPARTAHDARPVPEARAASVIARVFRENDLEPEAARSVHLTRDKSIKLEVAAAHHQFGVAYVSEADAAQLGDALPHRPKGTRALVVVQGEQGAHVLVLFEGDYVDDDADGEDHTMSGVAADRKLERDVRDFLRRAERQSWP
jgi:hypothetical protein